MKRTVLLGLTVALVGLASSPIGAQQRCPQQRVEQENYLALSQQVYVYVPKIDKSDGGWRPFSMRVLVGQYRPPLLLEKGFMKEGDLSKLLSTRRDIVQYPLTVPGYTPKGASKATVGPPVSFTVGRASITVRVLGVEPAAGAVRTDRVLLEACGL